MGTGAFGLGSSSLSPPTMGGLAKWQTHLYKRPLSLNLPLCILLGGDKVKTRNVLLVILSLSSIILLSGCSGDNLKYQGVVRNSYDLEDHIAEELEAENPGLDIDVSIGVNLDE
jgi:hypothetical protein